MPELQTLEQACAPRPSVFDASVRDTVYNIDDLNQIDPGQFFAENWITEGMHVLLDEAFKRLDGRSGSAPGAFLLSQSMGGGKTHNLLALGLLAKYPSQREAVLKAAGIAAPSVGRVRVVTFSGRKVHTPFGIWGEIAEQLGRKDVFKNFYSPLQPPGDTDWVTLLRGEPVLLLLDELPPYFEAVKAVAVGATHLDTITTTALANLLVAVNSDKLPNACVVLTDLSSAAYAAGSASINEALANLERELGRGVVRIDPVRINTNELYQILRTRLFERVPDAATIDAVAEGFRQALERAKKNELTTASPDQLKADIRDTYPFHPAIRDLYARFKENPNFQQTRALIRIMRLVVATLWQSGEARRRYLVGANDLDLHEQQMLSEVRQINQTLEAAIAHDIASAGGGAIAEQIDSGPAGDAHDISTLIFLSSLSQATNPTLGLFPSEIAAALAVPGRDLSGFSPMLERLQQEAWYIHPTRDGRLLFKNTENLIAKLDTFTRNQLPEQKEAELRERLKELFEPEAKSCYQTLECLPQLDQIELQQDSITLIVYRPEAATQQQIETFYQHQQFKNRVAFITGSAAGYEQVLQRAAVLNAIRTIISELRSGGGASADFDRQFKEAEDIRIKEEGRFYQACRETFMTLLYPSRNGLTRIEFAPKYGANKYDGEEQVIAALSEVSKYTTNTSSDNSGFRGSFENKLWPGTSKEAPWSQIKLRAATDPSWLWHPRQALESFKADMLLRGFWREHGGFVERGPFPQPPASVTIFTTHRDEATGTATLRVKPQHADIVYWSVDGDATTASPRLEQFDFPTTEVLLSFLAVDSTGEHETGEPVDWTNTVALKYRLYQQGEEWRCELQALPGGAIRYTTDGSDPGQHGQPYDEPFIIPKECRFVQAVATAGEVRSELLRLDAPSRDGKGAGKAVHIDPARPATWRRDLHGDSTGESFTLLEQAQRSRAELANYRLAVVGENERWLEINTGEGFYQPAAAVTELATQLKDLLPEGNLDLRVSLLKFERGADLQDFVAELKETVKPGEVVQ